VNNAGAGYFGIQEAFTPAVVERQFATNVVGPLRVNRAFLPAMRERRSGLVVYVSSLAGRITFPLGGVYAASKWALEALAEASSSELAAFGIDVAIVQPDAFRTEIRSKIIPADDATRAETYGEAGQRLFAAMSYLNSSADGRDPADVARAIVRLANLPAGTRPLRTTVPGEDGVDSLNVAAAQVQAGVLEAMGLQHLLATTAAG
jgi:NAD(P)-dependent dehydrogenase (short-subunit alcohol dehydrogenase family)